MSLIQQIVAVVTSLPPEAAQFVLSIVRGAAASDDPARYLERRATADVAHKASQQLVEQILEQERARDG